jgi:hypothetical protein
MFNKKSRIERLERLSTGMFRRICELEEDVKTLKKIIRQNGLGRREGLSSKGNLEVVNSCVLDLYARLNALEEDRDDRSSSY